MNRLFFYLFLMLVSAGMISCRSSAPAEDSGEVPFLWDNASIYFMLTDRFHNGDPENDVNFGRSGETAYLRGFMGGDLRGIIQKIDEGYFSDLGISALWFTPVVEQIRGMVDEGTGDTYAYHGYWTRDWTAFDPNFGTKADLAELVEKAHAQGIRVVIDIVLNHTGPVTEADPVWPEEWVRTSPKCNFEDYRGSVECTLVENLPDIRTESDEEAELPPFLLEKWEKEGRLEQEMAELDDFFSTTGFPRAPKYYIMKWLLDYILDFGVDGYRVDTGRHVEEEVWAELNKLAREYFLKWKEENPDKVLDDNEFYIMGEMYNYGVSSMVFDFGDREVNYFDYGFNSLINFEFKGDVAGSYEDLFRKYSGIINGSHKDYGSVNYVSSHDDSWSFDREKTRAMEAGTKLLLSPGTAQVYYGDETARILVHEGATGDANLRSFMNWHELEEDTERHGYRISEVLEHWQKLGQFRRHYPSVGAGEHDMISRKPYFFKRSLEGEGYSDRVLVGLDLDAGGMELDVEDVFAEGASLKDWYSGLEYRVRGGKVELDTDAGIVLLGRAN